MTEQTHFPIAIIGSGFSGIGMAIRLKKEGIHDFVILERYNDVGGTWRDNSYPGCACDVESDLYSFSFAPNWKWTRAFSPQREIYDYLREVANRYGVIPHCRFGTSAEKAEWVEREQRWRIETNNGVITADAIVSAVGGLSEPSIPQLKGLESFQGRIFHSARWDHDYDLQGKKVAVIGTGASAIQFVPAIQPKVGSLKLFQRTPPWILPRLDRPVPESERQLRRIFPALQQASRLRIRLMRELFVPSFRNLRLASNVELIARRHLARAVKDPELRKKLTPNYSIGCKRILLSNNYLPSLTKPNVDVITDSIDEITPTGVRTKDGVLHEVDALIFGTGFQVSDMPIGHKVHRGDGQTLAEVWRGSPEAYVGTTVSGFPNLFMLQGPNTGLGHTSVVLMAEAQIEHVIKAINYMRKNRLAAIEPRAEAQAKFVQDIMAGMKGTVWLSGGCASWYLDANGRSSILWPYTTFAFERRVEPFNPRDYLTHPPNDRRLRDSSSGPRRGVVSGALGV